jgi:hypothetical protein
VQLAHRSSCARGLAGGQRERLGDELRRHAQVDALDALARRVAVELLVAALERRPERIRRADVVNLELVVLAGVAQVGASCDQHALGRMALVEQRTETLRLERAQAIGHDLLVPRLEPHAMSLHRVVAQR